MTSDIRQPDVGGLTSDPFLRSTTFTHLGLRARQKIRCAFWRERRAGRCKAPRRRRCGDIVEERQRRRYAPWPPSPAGLRLPRPANHCGLPVIGAAAKCQIILARALSAFTVKLSPD